MGSRRLTAVELRASGLQRTAAISAAARARMRSSHLSADCAFNAQKEANKATPSPRRSIRSKGSLPAFLAFPPLPLEAACSCPFRRSLELQRCKRPSRPCHCEIDLNKWKEASRTRPRCVCILRRFERCKVFLWIS